MRASINTNLNFYTCIFDNKWSSACVSADALLRLCYFYWLVIGFIFVCRSFIFDSFTYMWSNNRPLSLNLVTIRSCLLCFAWPPGTHRNTAPSTKRFRPLPMLSLKWSPPSTPVTCHSLAVACFRFALQLITQLCALLPKLHLDATSFKKGN